MARKKEPERVEINKTRIINAARKLFLKNGYEGTRMDDILAEAGMSRSTLYIYFKSKEEIKNYISLEAMEYFYGRLVSEIGDMELNMHEAYLRICGIMLEFKEQYPLNFEMIIENISVDDRDLSNDLVLQKIYVTGEKINELIVDRLQHSSLTTDNSNLVKTVFTIWGSLYGLITLADNKEAYIKKSMGVSKEEFLKQGFEKLYLVVGGDK